MKLYFILLKVKMSQDLESQVRFIVDHVSVTKTTRFLIMISILSKMKINSKHCHDFGQFRLLIEKVMPKLAFSTLSHSSNPTI